MSIKGYLKSRAILLRTHTFNVTSVTLGAVCFVAAFAELCSRKLSCASQCEMHSSYFHKCAFPQHGCYCDKACFSGRFVGSELFEVKARAFSAADSTWRQSSRVIN